MKHPGRHKVRLTTVALAIAGSIIALAAPAQADSTRYGSIAISESTGNTGRSWDYGSEYAAEAAAVDYCGKSDCYAYVSFASGWCAAVARTRTGIWSWARASNRAEAAANAIGASPGPNPTVQTTVCQD